MSDKSGVNYTLYQNTLRTQSEGIRENEIDDPQTTHKHRMRTTQKLDHRFEKQFISGAAITLFLFYYFSYTGLIIGVGGSLIYMFKHRK
ncbi:MAG: hypothetical protein INQ03_22630 [Candidatus Heimdallarchaeota archaeon]|nr:hypothetical protein [Candidatus Heimdallarchaeota archaeon]